MKPKALRAASLAAFRLMLATEWRESDDATVVEIAQRGGVAEQLVELGQHGGQRDRALAVLALFLADRVEAIRMAERLLTDQNDVVRKNAEAVLVGSGHCARSGIADLRLRASDLARVKRPSGANPDAFRYGSGDWWSGGKV